MRVLAVDPGREKCGVAAMEESTVLARAVVPAPRLAGVVAEWTTRYRIDRILLGNRTGSQAIHRMIAASLPTFPVILVAETGTTLDARTRYFRDHPPRGWRRLVPITLQIPPEPYDDYAAVVLAERYLTKRKSTDTQ